MFKSNLFQVLETADFFQKILECLVIHVFNWSEGITLTVHIPSCFILGHLIAYLAYLIVWFSSTVYLSPRPDCIDGSESRCVCVRVCVSSFLSPYTTTRVTLSCRWRADVNLYHCINIGQVSMNQIIEISRDYSFLLTCCIRWLRYASTLPASVYGQCLFVLPRDG